MIKPAQLDFFIKHNYNVIFEGEHGVGKTAIIKEAFDRNKLTWLYFSASTMDPWVDFIGVPKEEDGFLKLIRPKILSKPVDAIFLDEYNRSGKKVRNAVMELIQFGTINGEPLAGIKMVWVAVNPEDDAKTYDVERLDPAQADRFVVKVNIPYKPVASYFKGKYGELGRYAISWWNELPTKQKKMVSPRRLDYALDMYINKGDLHYVLDQSTNIPKLLEQLKLGPVSDRLNTLVSSKSDDEITKFFEQENNFSSCIKTILGNSAMISKFMPLLPYEKVAMLGNKHKKVAEFIVGNLNNPKILEIAQNISDANLNTVFAGKIQKAIGKIGRLDLSNTYHRRQSWEFLQASIIGNNVKDEDLNRTLKYLLEILDRTNTNSLSTLKDYILVCHRFNMMIKNKIGNPVHKTLFERWNKTLNARNITPI